MSEICIHVKCLLSMESRQRFLSGRVIVAVKNSSSFGALHCLLVRCVAARTFEFFFYRNSLGVALWSRVHPPLLTMRSPHCGLRGGGYFFRMNGTMA